MIMGEDESDEHIKIFECLVNTGAHVLRSSLERKVLHNIPMTFKQYLENTKHQFYHKFEKNRNKPCCSGQPHNCYFNGNMDKKIFNKVYNEISKSDNQQCLDRFEVRADVSIDKLDLSDLNFFLWNSNTLSQQEVKSLQTIMKIRSDICHPQSSHCYSIKDLEQFWVSLQNAFLLFAEPDSYKKIVTLLITTQKKSKVNDIESNRIINEMHTESENITHELKLEAQARNDCTNQLMKDESVGVKNYINNTYDKTTSFINETAQQLTENHKVLTTRCIEEIKTTVTEESSNTRLHNEDQRRAIHSQLTESENRVCQTVIHSGGQLEDKLTDQQNETRKHNVALNAALKEKDRKLTMLTAEVMDVKTEIKELKTILTDHFRKQKVELVMNTEKTERSKESPDNGKVEMTVKVNQAHVTEDKENEIIENLPPEVEIKSNNDCSPEEAVTETIEITGKRVNSIILELKATPGILHSVETFKAAIFRLVQVMQKAGGIDADIEDTVTVNLKFESPLTEDQFVVVKCLFANKSNSDSDTIQLADECSSISDEYLSTADVEKIESHSELDIYSQKEKSKVVQPNSTEAFTEPLCKYCDDKNKIIRTLKEKQYALFDMFESQKEQYRSRIIGTSLVNPLRDDIGMISNTEKLGLKLKESKSDDFSSLVSEQTYGLHDDDSKLRANKEDDGFPNRNLDDSEKIEELHQLLQRIDFKQKQMLKDKGIQQPSMFIHI